MVPVVAAVVVVVFGISEGPERLNLRLDTVAFAFAFALTFAFAVAVAPSSGTTTTVVDDGASPRGGTSPSPSVPGGSERLSRRADSGNGTAAAAASASLRRSAATSFRARSSSSFSPICSAHPARRCPSCPALAVRSSVDRRSEGYFPCLLSDPPPG